MFRWNCFMKKLNKGMPFFVKIELGEQISRPTVSARAKIRKRIRPTIVEDVSEEEFLTKGILLIK